MRLVRYTHGVILESHIGVGYPVHRGALASRNDPKRVVGSPCSVFVSSHGARIHKSHSSSVVRINGMAPGAKPG